MTTKNKGDLIIEFLNECKEHEDILCRAEAMKTRIDEIEKSIKADAALFDVIKNSGVSFLDSVVRYCPDMECLRIDAAPVFSANLTGSLNDEQVEALSVEQ